MTGIPIEDALVILTGKPPAPVDVDETEIERERMIRKKHRINDRAAWLSQLRRFHPDAIIPDK